MTTYYVASLARYVLVDAESETQARELGHAALHELYADLRQRWGKEVPIEIRKIREASSAEIALSQWHQHMLNSEKNG